MNKKEIFFCVEVIDSRGVDACEELGGIREISVLVLNFIVNQNCSNNIVLIKKIGKKL